MIGMQRSSRETSAKYENCQALTKAAECNYQDSQSALTTRTTVRKTVCTSMYVLYEYSTYLLNTCGYMHILGYSG